MPTKSPTLLLDQLQKLRRPSDAQHRATLVSVISQLARRKFRDASSLIRFHEGLLFMRAYPQTAELLSQTEDILANFKSRVDDLRKANADLSLLSEPEVSGIAGTSFSAIFSYNFARHLAGLHPSRLSLDWEGYKNHDLLAAVLSRVLPLIEENAYVDPYYPFLEWLHVGRPPEMKELVWLMRCFERLPVPAKQRAYLFDSLKLWLHFDFSSRRISRTGMRLPAKKIFYHDTPLIRRQAISLERELETDPLSVVKLSRDEGQALLDMGRTTMAARYRELHGFTYGDARHVVRADAGRGVEFFIWGAPVENRLETLGYHAALIIKNGVPHGYVEALSLFERAEVGLNIFYTFRDGESAWIFARVLRLFRQLLGTSIVSIEPYQLGLHNEEAIESGAFWFYRKLGFRPIRPEILKLVLSEERKIANQRGYRTPPGTLRRFSKGHVLYVHDSDEPEVWDRFHMRNLGLAVQRRMSRQFNGDANMMRNASTREVARSLQVNVERWRDTEQLAFSNWSLLLSLVPDLKKWSHEEKRLLVRIIRAKAAPDETKYVRLLLRHSRLREKIIKLGS